MKQSNRKGFTLTEILVVLVVAGILLALILPNTLKAIDRGNQTADESNVKTLQTAVFMCYTDKKDWGACADQDKLLDGRYLEEEVISPYDEGSYIFHEMKGIDGTGIKVCSSHDTNCPS